MVSCKDMFNSKRLLPPWKFNILAPENGWLEDEFPFLGFPIFKGLC